MLSHSNKKFLENQAKAYKEEILRINFSLEKLKYTKPTPLMNEYRDDLLKERKMVIKNYQFIRDFLDRQKISSQQTLTQMEV